MNAESVAASAQRLASRARALALALDARARGQRAAAVGAFDGVNAAYRDARARPRLSSFICAAFAEFSQGSAAHAAALEWVAQQTLADADRARDEQRRWGAIARGLQRRSRRLGQERSCRV